MSSAEARDAMELRNNTTKQAVYHDGALLGFDEVANVEFLSIAIGSISLGNGGCAEVKA